MITRTLQLGLAVAFVSALACAQVLAAPRVVATIKPLHALVAGIMQGVATPDLLIRSAASPHTYALRPSDARSLQRADIVFWIGPDLETFLDAGLPKLAPTAQRIALIDAPGIVHRKSYRHDAVGVATESKAGSRHAAHSASDHHSARNPHIWLDPENARAMLRTIAATLSRTDPSNQKRYETNRIAMDERLRRLLSETRRRLAPVHNRRFIVFHDAFQHFAERFDLSIAGVISPGEGRTPGARHVAALRARIQTQNVACVFVEPQFAPGIASSLVAGTAARTASLDPLGSGISSGPELYDTLIETNATAMLECLSRR